MTETEKLDAARKRIIKMLQDRGIAKQLLSKAKQPYSAILRSITEQCLLDLVEILK